jgi:hypothetical protein
VRLPPFPRMGGLAASEQRDPADRESGVPRLRLVAAVCLETLDACVSVGGHGWDYYVMGLDHPASSRHALGSLCRQQAK